MYVSSINAFLIRLVEFLHVLSFRFKLHINTTRPSSHFLTIFALSSLVSSHQA